MKHYTIGSVSTATMRPEDLIPTFAYELSQHRLSRKSRGRLRSIEAATVREGYYESEEVGFDLEWLFDALNEHAAPWMYFGAHPGDGADYGFWLSEEFSNDFDGLKVSDLSEIPSDYVGEVAWINDHGNITLYYRGRNHRLYEIWGVV